MNPYDDIDLEPLLNAPVWLDAHECFQKELANRTNNEKKRPYEDLYELVPLWLYARTCLEEEEDARDQTDYASQPAVNRLPRDILASIFEHLRDNTFQESSSNDATHDIHPYSWLSVTLVCRHWRNTAYSCPPLWTVIDLAYDREIIRSLLILSDNESLYIRADTSTYDVSSISDIGEYCIKIDLVMDEQARAEELELVLTSTKYVKLIPWKQFTSHPSSRLTKLTLKGTANNIKLDKRILPAFPATNFPQLRELVLDGLYPLWAATFLPELSRMQIKYYSPTDYDSVTGKTGHCMSQCCRVASRSRNRVQVFPLHRSGLHNDIALHLSEKMPLDDAFRRGIELFKQGRYEETLEAFNQAIRKNDKDRTLFDSRAAVLEKLDRPLDALKDSKRVIDLAPSSWQGYTRSARLFFRINKLEASLKMADLALERLNSADATKRAELEALREQVIKALEPPPCYFSRMPLEIQSEIFTLVIDKSNVKMLVLTLVCRRWREIILDTPNFWRHLVLTPKTRLKKVDAWLLRAKGILSSLRIIGGFDARPQLFRNASTTVWSTLDALEVADRRPDIRGILPPGAFKQLRLRSFRLAAPLLHDGTFQALCGMNTSRTQILDLKFDAGPIYLTGFPFTALTTLVLWGYFRNKELFVLLQRNPMLETVVLAKSDPIRIVAPIEDAGCIELANLRRLELSSCRDTDVILRGIISPNLEVLSVEHVNGIAGVISFEAVASQRLIHLKNFRLNKCTFSLTALNSILRAANELEFLRLSHCVCDHPNDDEGAVIEALAGAGPAAEIQNSSQMLCCPRLQHVDLSSSSRLKAGPIIRLIKAHLSNLMVPSDGEASLGPSLGEPQALPLPILSLNIDDCPMVDSDVLPWLRANVKQLSCKMTLLRMGGGRR